MAPFAKFRGHRRTSTPTSPNLSSLNSTPDSPHVSGAFDRSSTPNDSPFDTSLPSPRFHVPTFSGQASQSHGGYSGFDVTALPRFSEEDTVTNNSFAAIDQPRPASSSAAVPRPINPQGPIFQPAHRFKPSTANSEHYGQSLQTMGERPLFYDGAGDVRFGHVPGPFVERTLAEDLEASRGQTTRASKGRLNLLNPMSLLARRRSSQAVIQKNEEAPMTINSLQVPAMPDDYDPRIRGKIIHDFSTPRPRRNPSADAGQLSNITRRPVQREHPDKLQARADIGPPQDVRKNSKSPEHAPIFKEHFNDDRPILQPESKGYLHSLAATSSIPHPDHEPPALPAFARNLPMRLPDAEPINKPLPVPVEKTKTPPVSPPQRASAAISPPQAVSPLREGPPPSAILPKHMTSNASRFSFDMGGVGSSAQERLLEEKHKQKEAARKAGANADEFEESELDEYENYGFDDDDGLEESIPGVNADAEEEDFEEALASGVRLQHFHFTPPVPSAVISPTTTLESGQTSFPTPRDDHGQTIGFAMSKESPDLSQNGQFYQLDQKNSGTLDLLGGLGITSLDRLGLNQESDFRQADDVTPTGFDEEDMYFDDGDIQLGIEDEGLASFDESIFDDETGKIRDIPAQNALKYEAAQQRQLVPDQCQDEKDLSIPVSLSQKPSPIEESQEDKIQETPMASLSLKTDFQMQQNVPERSIGLTEVNMAAYQRALVSAANEAAANGRFKHAKSISQSSEGQASYSQMNESHPGLVSDDSRVSQLVEPPGHLEVPEDFGFEEDEMDDDLMIAEANAEALENDEDGFYGREFGFYSRTNGKGEGEMVNGGYFGPRGVEGINRSHSGRANFQEPSLTPITERSEWSARNSMASLQTFALPQSAHSLPSPALAQLIDNGSFEDDMSLSALMRLRRGAWGGSQTSLHSSANSQASNSPHTHAPPRDLMGSPFSADAPGNMSSSVYSLNGSVGIPESEDDGEDAAGSPTITQTTPRKRQQPGMSNPQYVPISMPPVAQYVERPRAHSRNSSGAESVSYVRDPEAPGRFIVERKRTLESGEIELIGREVLMGSI